MSTKVGTLMELYIAKPEFVKIMKISKKYSHSQNVPNLVTSDVPHDVDKTIDSKVIKETNRLRNDQICTAITLSSLGGVLDIIREVKNKHPNSIQADEMMLASITMLGLVHNDFSLIRLKGFRQTVHPFYDEIFMKKTDKPKMLMGKTLIAVQVKSVNELNKLKAKLKKPDLLFQSQKAYVMGFSEKRRVSRNSIQERMTFMLFEDGTKK